MKLRRASILFLCLFYAAGARASFDDFRGADDLSKVESLPAFNLTDLAGNPVRSEEIVGRKVVLMAFWSVYCKACVDKFGSLVKIRRKYPPDLLEVISINTDREYGLPAETIREFVRGLEAKEGFTVNFPIVYEGGDSLTAQLGISFLPTIISVNRQGKIVGVYRRFTEDSEEQIIRGIETIIPEEGRVPPP